MSLKKNNYINRLIDEKVDIFLNVFGAVSIEGPKWCGKTYTSYTHANEALLFDDENTLNRAKMDLDLLLSKYNNFPVLIDEWNLYPDVWDKIRRKCDDASSNGNYILTCSTKLEDEELKKKIKHSGAGRIGKIEMSTMTLYETGDSTGKVSIRDLYNNKFENGINKEIDLESLAKYIIRGGWPKNQTIDNKYIDIIPKSYIENILDVDMNKDKRRNKIKMQMLLRSLSRNETTMVKKQTLLKDIFINEDEKELLQNRITLDDYLDVLKRLHILVEQNPYSMNYRSPNRVGKSSKYHLIDPSLACACLNLNVEKLLEDPKTFGFMFESLVEHDLEVYINTMNGKLYHFRDNISGLEIDSILEFEDGNYAAVEIKLTENGIEEAKKNLLNFKNNVVKEPKFMCIIIGNTDMMIKDKETGIYILPVTALKP